jgi:hypothetical protein
LHAWIQVVTQPLGLAGFALFLVFGYVAKVKKDDERRWLSRAAVALAIIALGGLILAYVQIPKPATPSAQTSKAQQQKTSQVQQSTTGPGSPGKLGRQQRVAPDPSYPPGVCLPPVRHLTFRSFGLVIACLTPPYGFSTVFQARPPFRSTTQILAKRRLTANQSSAQHWCHAHPCQGELL